MTAPRMSVPSPSVAIKPKRVPAGVAPDSGAADRVPFLVFTFQVPARSGSWPVTYLAGGRL